MQLPPRATRSVLRGGLRGGRRVQHGVVAVRTGNGPACVGYALGKNLGPAVVRNRTRRRLRAAIAEQVPSDAIDRIHLVIGLPGIERATWPDLVSDVTACFEDLHGR